MVRPSRALIAVSLLLIGCTSIGSVPSADATPPVEAKPAIAAPYRGPLPRYATHSAETEAAYRWAATNDAILRYFQCTCGCENSGHKSNWNCYVKEREPDGEFIWDPMSAG